MSNFQRTTIVLHQDLLEEAKLYALSNKTTVSQLLRECLIDKIRGRRLKKKKSILELAGRLNLGGKEPPKRNKIYEGHIKN